MPTDVSHVEKIILVHVVFKQTPAEALDEFIELAASTGAEIVSVVTTSRHVPDAKFFIGSGKANEVRELVASSKTSLVIFNHVLTPGQERNLERYLNCRVLDKTGLILDIFARRARSFEGKLQVELALLKHQSTRLVRGWTHLERQRGGIGLRGGPGETQLEVDRRLIRNKIKQITERLSKIRKQRALSRRSRRKAVIPTVALVGYTNVGKSTLFNQLTGSGVYVADQLFATLDPTLRRVDFKQYGPIIFADTVGFIRDLPHDLVEAFHATLEEVSEADLLLLIVDANHHEREAQISEVQLVLDKIQANNVPFILVYNKVDLLPVVQSIVQQDQYGEIKRIFVSAKTGAGMTTLVHCIGEYFGKALKLREVTLTPQQSKLRAMLYRKKAVLAEKIDELGNYHLSVQLSDEDLQHLLHKESD